MNNGAEPLSSFCLIIHFIIFRSNLKLDVIDWLSTLVARCKCHDPMDYLHSHLQCTLWSTDRQILCITGLPLPHLSKRQRFSVIYNFMRFVEAEAKFIWYKQLINKRPKVFKMLKFIIINVIYWLKKVLWNSKDTYTLHLHLPIVVRIYFIQILFINVN